MTASYRTEFPDFDPATMPAIPDGWVDTSWHNEPCPTFAPLGLNERGEPILQVMVDYADRDQREFPLTARFSLCVWAQEDFHLILETDDWFEIPAAVEEWKSGRQQ